jgi:hypothetical protein
MNELPVQIIMWSMAVLCGSVALAFLLVLIGLVIRYVLEMMEELFP